MSFLKYHRLHISSTFFPPVFLFFVVAVDIIIIIKGSTHKIIAVTICITECGYISHGFIPL